MFATNSSNQYSQSWRETLTRTVASMLATHNSNHYYSHLQDANTRACTRHSQRVQVEKLSIRSISIADIGLIETIAAGV